MAETQNKLILQQVEYYFSDANIVRDEFLKKLISVNDGWAPMNVINSFGKMEQFKKTDSELEDILKESEKLEVESGRVRRTTPIPSYSEHKGDERTLIIKNFPVEYTLEEVQRVLKPHESRIARIAMRKDALKEFKGSVFVELHKKEDMEILKDSKIAIEAPVESEENQTNTPPKKAKIELEIIDSSEYFNKKKEARREEKEKKKQEVLTALTDAFKNKIFKFTAEKDGEAAKDEEISALKISDVKEALEKDVAFVDIPNRHIRMREDKEEVPSISINGLDISFSKLSEEEVAAYCSGLSLTEDKAVSKPRRRVPGRRR